jgi:hypothetical protein
VSDFRFFLIFFLCSALEMNAYWEGLILPSVDVHVSSLNILKGWRGVLQSCHSNLLWVPNVPVKSLQHMIRKQNVVKLTLKITYHNINIIQFSLKSKILFKIFF